MSEVKIASKHRDVTFKRSLCRVFPCPQCNKMATPTFDCSSVCLKCELKFNVCVANQYHPYAVYMYLTKATMKDDGYIDVIYPDPANDIQAAKGPLLVATKDEFGGMLYQDEFLKLEFTCPVCYEHFLDPDEDPEIEFDHVNENE